MPRHKTKVQCDERYLLTLLRKLIVLYVLINVI